jgi:hypothetical protein
VIGINEREVQSKNKEGEIMHCVHTYMYAMKKITRSAMSCCCCWLFFPKSSAIYFRPYEATAIAAKKSFRIILICTTCRGKETLAS